VVPVRQEGAAAAPVRVELREGARRNVEFMRVRKGRVVETQIFFGGHV
jgi:hypothetical protein